MKLIIRPSRSLLIMLFLAVSVSYAQIGCMEKTKHGNTQKGYDYKTLHYVHCNCDCARHAHLARRGKCMQCRQYVKHPYRDIF